MSQFTETDITVGAITAGGLPEGEVGKLVETTACANCGSSESAPLYTLGDYLYHVDGEFSVQRCVRCGLVYLSPRPTRAAITRYYPASYSPYRRAIQDERSGVMRWMRRRKIVKRRQAVERRVSRLPGDLLDAGCSTGIFMDEMRSAGWRVIGIEISAETAAYARRRLGLDVIQGDLPGAGLAPESFDAVTMFDVLEHTYDPPAVLAWVWRVLRPGGVAALTFPNWESLDRRLFGKYWIGYDAPRHLHVFPRSVIQRMLEDAGFQVVDNRCLFGGYFTFVMSLRAWLRADGSGAGRLAEKTINFPGIRLPFEPLFMLLDRLGKGSNRFIVARKPLDAAHTDQESAS